MKRGEFTSECAPGERRIFIDVMSIQEDLARLSTQAGVVPWVFALTQSSCLTSLGQNMGTLTGVTKHPSFYYSNYRTGFLAASDDPVQAV